MEKALRIELVCFLLSRMIVLAAHEWAMENLLVVTPSPNIRHAQVAHKPMR
jgi:hypothetical protein